MKSSDDLKKELYAIDGRGYNSYKSLAGSMILINIYYP